MRINGKTPRKILKIKSVREFLDWLPVSFAQGLAMSAFLLTALAPLLVSIKAPGYIDPRFFAGETINKYYIAEYYLTDFSSIMQKIVFPYVWAAALLAYLIILCKNRGEKRAKLKESLFAPALALFGLLAVWVLCNVYLVNGPTFYAIEGAAPNRENLKLYLEYYFCFFLMGMLLIDRQRKRNFFRFFAAVSLAMVPFAVWLHLNVYTNDAILCVYSNSNYYGIFLNVVIGMCAAMLAGESDIKWKGFFFLALVVNTAVLYFNNTMGAWVGAFFACLFAVIAFRIRDGKFNRWSLVALALFFACLIVCGFVDKAFISGENNFTRNFASLFRDILNVSSDPNSAKSERAGSGRWIIWKYYLSLIKEHPWFGVGLDGVRALDIGQAIKQKRAHNEYIQYAAFLGIPGLLLYFSACLSVYIRAIRYRRYLDNLTLAALTAAFGYLVGAFFGNTVYNTTPYLYIMLGLGYVNTTLPDRCSGYEQA